MNTPVVIAGAGPTGLTLAIQLAEHGVSCRIFESRTTHPPHSRALAVQSRTLELLAPFGLAAKLGEKGRILRRIDMWSGGAKFAELPLEVAESSFSHVLSVPQSVTEEVLEEHLASLGIRVERGRRVEDFHQVQDGIEVAISGENGHVEKVVARWLAACDGARSIVRRRLAIPFEGDIYEEEFLLGDVRLSGYENEEGIAAFVGSKSVLGVIPLPTAGEFRLVVLHLEQGTDPSGRDLLAELAAEVSAAIPGARLEEALWCDRYRVQRRMAPAFRVDRVFLAGDAAHVQSPAGGQGMNVGMQDAFNLGWKMALVEKGIASEELLDSYTEERRPIADSMLKVTHFATRALGLRGVFSRVLRNRLGHFVMGFGFVRDRVTRVLSEIDVSYRNSPIVREDHISIFDTRIEISPPSEIPIPIDWIDFASAPRAGDRFPDVEYAPGVSSHGLLDGKTHLLLLFDGFDETAEGYDHFEAIQEAVTRFCGGTVRIKCVVPFPEVPEELAGKEVIVDGEAILHERFGAGTECLYLIRPDGYIGYRAQPVDRKKFLVYLRSIFRGD